MKYLLHIIPSKVDTIHKEVGNLKVIPQTLLAFFLLLILARLLGKKQISQMTFFDYVTGITVGSLTANIISVNSKSILDEVIGLITWGALTISMEYIVLKSTKIRILTEGQPVILIKNGKIMRNGLKSNRLHLDELSMLLRTKNIFSFKDVDYAILETNGQITVLKKQAQLTVNKADMNIPTVEPLYLPSEIITDGEVVEKNLRELGLSHEWLEKQLKNHNINDIREVLYAQIQGDGTLYIDKI